jgi:hypothetical protein
MVMRLQSSAPRDYKVQCVHQHYGVSFNTPIYVQFSCHQDINFILAQTLCFFQALAYYQFEASTM